MKKQLKKTQQNKTKTKNRRETKSIDKNATIFFWIHYMYKNLWAYSPMRQSFK